MLYLTYPQTRGCYGLGTRRVLGKFKIWLIWLASTHSKSEVVEAGKKIASKLQLNDEAIAAYRIAHNWRASHVHPMRKVRHELAYRARKIGVHGVAVGRFKRMQSIRRKLARGNRTLYQMQDIGGARIILKDMEAANQLIQLFVEGCGYRPLFKPNDYILRRKRAAIAAIAIFKFNGDCDDPALPGTLLRRKSALSYSTLGPPPLRLWVYSATRI